MENVLVIVPRFVAPSFKLNVRVIGEPQPRPELTVNVKSLVALLPPAAIAPKFCAPPELVMPPPDCNVAVKLDVAAPPLFCNGRLTLICSPGSGELFGVLQLSETICGVPVELTATTGAKQKLTVCVCPAPTLMLCAALAAKPKRSAARV